MKANRQTEELYNSVVKNDVRAVYAKIDEGADVNFVFGPAYQCPGTCIPGILNLTHSSRAVNGPFAK